MRSISCGQAGEGASTISATCEQMDHLLCASTEINGEYGPAD